MLLDNQAVKAASEEMNLVFEEINLIFAEGYECAAAVCSCLLN